MGTLIKGRRWYFKGTEGWRHQLKGTNGFLTVFDLLLQIIEVHFDLGLEVPAPRPKSCLPLKRSRPRPPPPPVEVTPPPPPPRPISQRVLDIGKGHRLSWPQRVLDPRKIMRAPSYGPKFFLLRMLRIDVTLFLAGLHWPLGKSPTAKAPCNIHPTTCEPLGQDRRGGARNPASEDHQRSAPTHPPRASVHGGTARG